MAGSGRKRTGHGGARKYGRNRDKCAKYRSEGRREANKLRNVARHNGAAALAAYREYLAAR